MSSSRYSVFRFALVGRALALGLILSVLAISVWAATPFDIAGYLDFSYGDVVKAEPTADDSESKLWWHDGRWWGVLWSPAANAYHIHELDLATHDWSVTGTLVDDRPGSRSDVLWDGSKLYVASHIEQDNPGKTTNPDNWARLYRFSYDSGSESYSLDNGFPVTINEDRTRTLVIDKDNSGRLWATYISREQSSSVYQVYATYTTGNDTSWAEPFVLPVAANKVTVQRDDTSALAAFQDNDGQHVGVLWSNQLTTTNPLDSSFYLASHPVSAAPETQWTLESGLNTAVPYAGDDHMNLATTPSGELLAVVKTNETDPADPLIGVIARSLSGAYSFDAVSQVVTGDTRPTIVVDGDAELAYVFVTSQAGGGLICFQTSLIVPLSAMNFPDANCTHPNVAEPLPAGITMADMPPAIGSTTYTKINNATSTKQMTSEASGVVVLATDDDDPLLPVYGHNVLVGAAPVDDRIFISSNTDGAVGGLAYADEDILLYDGSSGAWSMHFDGSDVGLAISDIKAFTLLPDGSILFSLDSSLFDLPGVGIVEDSDIARFIPTSLGANTAGTFQMIFDGSDVGLEAAEEGIDAIAVASNRLLISTLDGFEIGAATGEDEDVLLFRQTSLGYETSGSFSLAFDGSDVGLDDDSEDIWGVWVDLATQDVYLTTEGTFTVDGSSGDGTDIFICHLISFGVDTACTFGPGLYWDATAAGFTGASIDGFAIELAP